MKRFILMKNEVHFEYLYLCEGGCHDTTGCHFLWAQGQRQWYDLLPIPSRQASSMKVDERYYCFGCHQTGDAIDFVSQLFGLTLYQAARKLAEDFDLHPSPSNAAVLSVPKHEPVETARNREGRCVSALSACERLLKSWKECYAPSDPESDWDARYIVACNALPQVSYLLDCLTSADAKERVETADALLQDHILDKITSFLADRAEDAANMAA